MDWSVCEVIWYIVCRFIDNNITFLQISRCTGDDKMSKLLRIGLIFVIVLLIVVIIGFFALKSYLTPETIRGIAKRVASETVQHPVEMGKVGLKIGFKIGITIDDVLLPNTKGFTPGPMVEVDRIALNLKLLALLRRQIEIGSIDISGMKMNLERNREGLLNIVPIVPKESKGTGWALSLASISIRDGDLRYRDAKNKTEFRIKDIKEMVTYTRNTIHVRGENRVHLIKTKELPELILDVSNDIEYDTTSKAVKIKKLAIRYDPIYLEASGIIEKMERLNLSAQMDIGDMNKLSPVIPLDSRPRRLSGRLKSDLKILGTLKEPTIKGECELKNVTIIPKGMSRGFEELKGNVSFDADAIENIAVQGRIGDAQLEIGGAVQNLKNPMLNLTAKLDGDLSDLESMTDDMKQIRMKGPLQVQMTIKGKTKNPSYFGEYNIEDASLDGVGLAKPITQLHVKGTIKTDEVKIDRCKGRIGRSDFSLSGRVSNFKKPVVELTNKSNVIDLDELIPKPEKGKKKEGGAVPLTLRGDIHINTLSGMDMVFKNVNTHFVYENGIIDLKDCIANAFDGKVKFDFYYDAQSPEPYRISTRMTELSAKEVLQRFLKFDNLEGRLTGMSNFRGNGFAEKDVVSNLSASGNLKVKNGIFKNFKFLTALLAWLGIKDYRNVELDDLAFYFNIDNGKATIKDWTLSSREGDFLTNGTVALDGRLNLNITTTLSKKHSDIVKKHHGDWLFPIDKKGRATIDIIASGKLTSPQFRLDKNKINKRLKGKIIDEFEKKKKEWENKLKDLFGG